MNFCNDFKYDLKLGQIKEKELAELLNYSSIEVKTDLQAAKTGNVFVEYKSREQLSGIATTKADFYCFVISKDAFIFITTETLKAKCRVYFNTSRDIKGGDNNTSQGILLPVKDLYGH